MTQDIAIINTSFNRERHRRHYIDLVFQNAKAGLRAEASRGYLGVLWWVIEPLLYMSVFYIVFAHLMQRGDESYIMFLLTGLIVWKWFATTITTGSNSLIANVGLMNQVYLPKIVFPLTTVAINTFKFLVIMALYLTLLQFTSIQVSLVWCLLPVLILLQLIFILALVCFLSAVMPFFPDLRVILDNLLMMMLFLSGIFFDMAKLPASIQKYLMLNPMAILIDMYRELLFKSIPPDLQQLLYVLLVSLTVLLLAIWLLHRFDRVYPKIIY